MMKSDSLAAIRVTVEQSSGNVAPLLHEIRHGLERLRSDGVVSSIDLKALPMAPGEEERILDILGSGEVRAEINALGKSEIAETAYPGVWLITHHDESGELLTRFIEITYIPEILRSQDEDVASGAARLAERLSALDPNGAS
jgi:hydrogenase-1 operon protein HyaF